VGCRRLWANALRGTLLVAASSHATLVRATYSGTITGPAGNGLGYDKPQRPTGPRAFVIEELPRDLAPRGKRRRSESQALTADWEA